MPSGVNIPITFEIHKGGEHVRTETLTQDIIKIGKLSSSHLRLDDESVSRMHAVIEVVGPQEIYIIDLGSTKGTIVNGQKINKTKVQTGDEVLLGDSRVVLTIGEPVAASTGPAKPAPGQPRATVMGMRSISGPQPVQPTGAPVPPPSSGAVPPPSSGAVPPPSSARTAGGGAIPPPSGAATARAEIPAPTGSIAAPHAAAPPPAGAQARPVGGGYAPQPPVSFDPEAVEVRDGTRAIEVVAMFEDAIVETRHFTDPDSGRLKPRTVGALAGGALSLLIAFALFLVAYAQVAHEKSAKEDWDRTHPGQESSSPKTHEGVGGDLVALALFANGLAWLVMGLYWQARERKARENPRDFTIGPDQEAIYNIPEDQVPTARFPLVHSTGRSYELLFTPQMKGDVTVDGQQIALATLAQNGKAHSSSEVAGAYAYAIPDGARAKVDFGETTFLINSVHPPRRYPVPVNIDWRAQMYNAGTVVVCALFLGMIFSLPPDPKSLSLDAFMNDQRFAKFLIKPPEEKEEQIPEWLKKKGPDEAGGKGKRHKGEEGKMGKKTSKNKTGLYALKGPKDNPDPHLAKMFAEEAAKNAGVLGILKQTEGSHLASIFGRDSALGSDAENVLGGLVGTQIGEAYGVGGLGLVGTGRGGGGTGEGTIGLGNLGTIGKGGGGGSGSGYGRGAGGLGGRRSHAPDVVPGTAQVRGALDKEIIRRIIRRHINEVKFCYEKELAKKPDLYGRVMVQFTIAGTGAVIASVVQNSTMGNPGVERCIADAVKRWEFPKPQGGGIVMVSYPFVLKASGGEGGE